MNVFDHNRVILCHFDTYSAASLFARYGTSLLTPNPLPEGAKPGSAPSEILEIHSPEKVLGALVEKYDFDPAELMIAESFQEWMESESGPIRIHLAKFKTFDPPRDEIEATGGIFKPISELRSTQPVELNLLRAAFNVVMSGG